MHKTLKLGYSSMSPLQLSRIFFIQWVHYLNNKLNPITELTKKIVRHFFILDIMNELLYLIQKKKKT